MSEPLPLPDQMPRPAQCLTPPCAYPPGPGLEYCCVACARGSWNEIPGITAAGHSRACQARNGPPGSALAYAFEEEFGMVPAEWRPVLDMLPEEAAERFRQAAVEHGGEIVIPGRLDDLYRS
jgi:hypothetical protein